MAQFTVFVQATSNATINTDDTFLELAAPSGKQFKVKRVRVGYSDGTATVGVDNHFRVKLYRWDTTTAGTTASPTVVARNANSPANVVTVKSKSGATACALGTTNVTLIDVIAPNGRALYELLARDDDDFIVVKATGLFAVVLSSAVTAQLFTVSVDWVE